MLSHSYSYIILIIQLCFLFLIFPLFIDLIMEEIEEVRDDGTTSNVSVVVIKRIEEMYELGRIIGRGGYSCVRVAIDRSNGKGK